MSESETKEETIICRCKDVTLEEIENAIDEGYDDIELLKRKTKVMSGTCQGRTCLELVQKILARKTNKEIKDIRLPRDRAPIIPIPLRFMAGESREEKQ